MLPETEQTLSESTAGNAHKPANKFPTPAVFTRAARWAVLLITGSARLNKVSTAEWYNGFADFYDSGELRYRSCRLELIKQLRLRTGHTVMDVACGTGQNFDLIVQEIGGSGQLIGVDYSTGMLKKAKERIKRHGWSSQGIRLVYAEAVSLNQEMLRTVLADNEQKIDRIICSFGLAVATDWEDVFACMWDVLAPGGRCALMDGYLPNPRGELRPRLVNTLSRTLTRADVTRRFWEPLRKRSQDYEERRYPYRLGTQLVIASGTKPNVGSS